MRRVVVTGLGAVTPCGNDLTKTWNAVTELKSGIREIQSFDTEGFPCRIGGECVDFDPEQFIEKRRLREGGRFIHLSIGATHMAVEDSGILSGSVDKSRVGTVIGVGMCGVELVEKATHIIRDRGPRKVSPYFVSAAIANMAAGQVSMRYGLEGPNLCTTSACSSGAHALGEGMRWIRHGIADAVVAGGAEATIAPVALAGFSSMRALTKRNDEPGRASRPFDVDRDGFAMSEGSATLVLEELDHAKRRGAHIYAELVGYGATADAFHLTQPAPEGRGAAKAMGLALKDASLGADTVDYLNAHATSTPHGDVAELDAIRTVFGSGNGPAVSSTKGATGHLLGAAGTLEAAFSVLAIDKGIAPATANLEQADDAATGVDLVAGESRDLEVACAMTNAFGFGGTNVSLVMREFEV